VASERFADFMGSSLDDNVEWNVEPLVASFQPETVDVSPSAGLDPNGTDSPARGDSGYWSLD
jgi:hypothetical protein